MSSSRIDSVVPGIGASLDASPDGKTYATLGAKGSGRVEIRDVATGEPVRAWVAHERDALDVAFSADGAMLATTGNDGAAKVWDPRTGTLLHEVRGPPDRTGGRCVAQPGRQAARRGLGGRSRRAGVGPPQREARARARHRARGRGGRGARRGGPRHGVQPGRLAARLHDRRHAQGVRPGLRPDGARPGGPGVRRQRHRVEPRRHADRRWRRRHRSPGLGRRHRCGTVPAAPAQHGRRGGVERRREPAGDRGARRGDEGLEARRHRSGRGDDPVGAQHQGRGLRARLLTGRRAVC